MKFVGHHRIKNLAKILKNGLCLSSWKNGRKFWEILKSRGQSCLQKISKLKIYGLMQSFAKHWKEVIKQRTESQPVMRAGMRILYVSKNRIESLDFDSTEGARFRFQTAVNEVSALKQHNDKKSAELEWCSPARLKAFINYLGWTHGSLLLVVATTGVRHRVVEVRVKRVHQIRSVLSFELHSELLEGLDNLVYDFSSLPISAKEGSNEVLVRLLAKQPLMEWVGVCEEKRLHVRRVTFSAQALYESLPAAKTNEYVQVYLGQGECLVNHILAGSLYRSYVLPSQLADSPPDKDLRAVCLAVVNWMRLQGIAKNCRVSLHGDHADKLQWSLENGLELTKNTKAKQTKIKEQQGLLKYLVRGNHPMIGMTGTSFYRGKAVWASWLREHRVGLATTLGLFLLVCFFGGKNLSHQLQGRQKKLDILSTEVQKNLGLQGNLSPLAIDDALGRLAKEVGDLRSQYKEVELLGIYQYEVLRLFKEISKSLKGRIGTQVDNFRYTGSELVLGGRVKVYTDSEFLRDSLMAIPGWVGSKANLTHSRNKEGIVFQLNLDRSGIAPSARLVKSNLGDKLIKTELEDDKPADKSAEGKSAEGKSAEDKPTGGNLKVEPKLPKNITEPKLPKNITEPKLPKNITEPKIIKPSDKILQLKELKIDPIQIEGSLFNPVREESKEEKK